VHEGGKTPPGLSVKVAVIIVNYNSGAMLEECLTGVFGQSRPPDRVIVVDNGSSDDSLTGPTARWPRLEVIAMGYNAGFAAANNRAIEACGDCDGVALLNPDACPDRGWLAALLAAADDLPEAASFASCMVSAKDPQILDGAGDAYHVSGLVWRIGHGLPKPASQARTEVFAPCAAAALYRRDAVQAAGAFDESYFCYNEDVDLGFRLRLRGWSCWYVPDAVVTHVGSAFTGRHSDFSLFHGHRNLVWTYVKNMPASLLRRFLWQHLLLNLVAVIVLSARYRTFSILKAKWSALRGLGRAWRARKGIQAARSGADDRLLDAMVTGWWRCYTGRQSIG